MGDRTGIAWTDKTWNPWQGCHKVSAGCKLCYMFREKTAYGQEPNVVVRSKPATFEGTSADNAHDRDAKGRTARTGGLPRPGALNPAAKLTADDVASIRQYYSVGASQRSLATQFRMSQSQIGNIVRGVSWR